MFGESQISDPAPASDAAVVSQPPLDPALPDPLKEVWALKRRVQLGVFGAILALIPFYLLVVPLSPLQFVAVYGFSLCIAVTAIEFAFAQVFKLRKQSSYPAVLVVQLGQADSLAVAYQASLDVLQELLQLSGAFLCLLRDDGLSPVALTGLRRLTMDNLLRLGAGDIQNVIETSNPATFRPSANLLSQAVLPLDTTLVFVPVHSLQRTIGVLGLLAPASTHDVRDPRLLAGLGLALGLSVENLRQKEELRQQAAVDDLTKVYNRRYFFDELNREMAFARRYSTPLAVAILDVDGLKAINDQRGHAAGDEVLREIALRLIRFSRGSDLSARIGGDEFALILPRADARSAQEVVGRLQWAVEQQPVALADGQEITIAISCGTASFPEEANDADALLRRADAVMYCVKSARRPASDLPLPQADC